MPRSWRTKLIHSDVELPEGYRSLATPVFRGSTTVFPSAAKIRDNWRQHEVGWVYGVYGTPTALELAGRIAELEGGYRTFLAPGGQSALAVINLAMLGAGDHVLIPDSIYSPHRQLADDLLGRLGVECDYYPPTIGAGIDSMFRERTRLVWCESPGSITMEVQDVPAIAGVAHRRGAKVALDNTYSAGVYFDAFGHGVDVTTQALTKYIGGHSDLLLGSVTVRDAADYERIGSTLQMLGMAVSPDDCSLALRGMLTLGVRLAALERSTLEVAHWLSGRREIARVLHPALPSCEGHDLWRRDFTGSTSVFSVEFQPDVPRSRVRAFVDALELFEIGWSWGGVTSLAVPVNPRRTVGERDRAGALVRFNVGLEDPADLIADLDGGLRAILE
jgi:cysteine-S-conjugate beta-lyase